MIKSYKKPLKGIVLLAAVILLLDSCKKDNNYASQPTIAYGEIVAVGSGKAQSFVTKDANGNPQSIGFNFSEEALTNLPSQNTMMMIPAPANNGTLVDHMSFDFNVHGHEPPGIYDVPHFDIHFYMISEKEQDAIVTGTEMQILPGTDYIPKDYGPIPGGDPKMGKHWADLTAKEFNGQPFDHTFIFGSYNGKFIFHEAMVSLAFFQSKKNFTDMIKMQAQVQRDGYYPKTYGVTYDANKKLYTVMLDQMTLRHL
jgi:hypothetical protein